MTRFVCENCGYGSASWLGKCPSCDSWNSLREFKESTSNRSEDIKPAEFTQFSKIKTELSTRKKTGVFEFDRVLGGGIAAAAVIMLSGEPGVGKSTVLLKSLSALRVLYVSGEESGPQIKNRADRINVRLTNFYFSDQIQVDGIIASLTPRTTEFDVLVIDSIQTVYTKDVKSQAGSVSQSRESAARLISFAKKNNLSLIIVGHITKSGDIAGPKTLEHMVDVVLFLEGEKMSNFRIMRALKNRFGPTDEVGIFEMTKSGLVEVRNPAAFLAADRATTAGSAVIGVNEGSRPLFFEVQCLVVPTILSMPRRVVSGVDYNKVLLLLAVIRKQLNLPVDTFDIYINVAGGLSVRSPAADLAIAAAIISSIKNIALPLKSIFTGEIGLLGEVREVLAQEKITKEAGRLGFKKIYSSKNLTSLRDIQYFFK